MYCNRLTRCNPHHGADAAVLGVHYFETMIGPINGPIIGRLVSRGPEWTIRNWSQPLASGAGPVLHRIFNCDFVDLDHSSVGVLRCKKTVRIVFPKFILRITSSLLFFCRALPLDWSLNSRWRPSVLEGGLEPAIDGHEPVIPSITFLLEDWDFSSANNFWIPVGVWSYGEFGYFVRQ